jgi:hypothetical protein
VTVFQREEVLGEGEPLLLDDALPPAPGVGVVVGDEPGDGPVLVDDLPGERVDGHDVHPFPQGGVVDEQFQAFAQGVGQGVG